MARPAHPVRSAAQPLPNDNGYWSAEGFAAHRGCTVKALRKLRNERGLPAEKTGPEPDDYRYPAAAVASWEAACAYWSSAELCARRGCSAKVLRTLREQQGLPHEQEANGFRYPIAPVLAWEEERRIVKQPRPPSKTHFNAGFPAGHGRGRDRRGPRARQGLSGPRPVAVSF
jgi:hypothetical protein